MRFFSVLLTVLVFRSSLAMAAIPRVFSVGVNELSHGLNRESKNPAGETSSLGTMYSNLDFQLHVPVGINTLFSPRLIWAPDALSVKDPGGTSRTSFLIVGLPLTFNTSPSFDFNIGPALLTYQIKGDGGTTTLNNGNGTSVFAVPGRSQSAQTVALLLGASYDVSRFRFSFDTLTESLGSNAKRTYSLMLTLSYALFQY